MKKKLKHCPFCGGEVRMELGPGGLHYIICDNCGAIVSFCDPKLQRREVPDVSSAYNSRVGDRDGGKR